jgi:hypothetical protein
MAPFGLLIGALVLVIGCCVLAWTLVYWRKQRGYRGQPEYYLTCRYPYEGQTYPCDQAVWRDHYE